MGLYRRSFLRRAAGALSASFRADDLLDAHPQNVMENHSVGVPWWGNLVNGIEKPIVNKGFITVPDKPGLGVTLEPDFLQPTTQWNNNRSNDRLWS